MVLNYLKWYSFILFLHTYLVFSSKTYGPYKVTVTNVTNYCSSQLFPYEKKPTATVRWYKYKSRGAVLLGANLTIHRTAKNMKGRVKAFDLKEDGRLELTYVMADISCRSIMLTRLLSAMDLKLNLCAVPKGNYSFTGFDIDKEEHRWRKQMTYGTMVLRTEVIAHSATVVCYELTTTISPPTPAIKKNWGDGGG